ncbi:MAG: hypothetical protein QGH51_09745 [Planctomycetota bacterium]|jgi:hypothetical protein|nr:hypothetical protein [Planctomycetota bacterium]MDP6942293.1 hypothetical protein [Planctomycetota bacterium]
MTITKLKKTLIPTLLLSLMACGGESVSSPSSYENNLVFTAGASKVNQSIIQALLDSELTRRSQRGDDMSLYEVTEADIDGRLVTLEEQAKTRNPDIDFWEQVEATGNTVEGYRLEARNSLLIDRLLFPPNPEAWNLDDLGEIFQKGEPNSMYENMVEGATKDAFKAAWDKGETYQVDEMMSQMILRPYFMRWLWLAADIKYPFDGLPEGVALQINEMQISTTEMLARCELLIGSVEKNRARNFTDTVAKVAADLDSKGLLISKQEALNRIDIEKVEYENSPISYEQVVLQFYGYPTMEAYHQVYRLRESFKDQWEGTLPEEGLKANLEARKNFLADGKADAEVILFSARSMETGRYPMEGDAFKKPKENAEIASKELAAGADWGETLMKWSELPEKVPGAPAQATPPNRGRFGSMSLNPLKEFFGENEYLQFVEGGSLAEHIFFDAVPGQIYGPARGATGWYIYKLNHRTEPAKVLDWKENERHKFLVESDFVNVNFFKYIDEVMAN